MGQHGQWSEDGKWWWNGREWVATTPASLPSASSYRANTSGGVPAWLAIGSLLLCFPLGLILVLLTKWSTKTKAIVDGAVVVLVVLVGIAGSASSSGRPTASSSATSQPQSVVRETTVPTPRATATPTAPPTPVPTPISAQIIQQAQGSKVLPVDIPRGNYRLSWEAGGGTDNFIVHIHQGSADQGLINEIPPAPASGQTFFRSSGGSFQLEVKASTLTWKLTFLQLLWPADPKPAPSPHEISLNGTGSTVSDPVFIPRGNYKLAWAAQGGENNFIVHLLWAETGERGLVNEIPPNPSSGEVFMDSGGGYHVLEVKASTLQWTIKLTPV